jgi:hypothetical protein
MCRIKASQYNREYRKRKRKQVVPTGLKQCTNCCKNKPEDQFVSTHVRIKTLTAWCRGCRDSSNRSALNPCTAKGACFEVWKEWQRGNPCPCGETRAIEAPGALHPCGHTRWWSNHGGVVALCSELVKLRPLCRWCNRLRKKTVHRGICKRRRYTIITNEKLCRGQCLTCLREVTVDNASAFDFDHREPVHKKHDVAQMVNLPEDQFKILYPLEIVKCDLLCCMCHYEKTHYNHIDEVIQ